MVNGADVMLLPDIPLGHPNTLPPAQFAAESSGPVYLASENFTFFAKTADLGDAQAAGVLITGTRACSGPWLPWMKMGTRPGCLLYSGHGKRFAKFSALRADLQACTVAHFPAFQSAPSRYESSNETGWSDCKKQAQPKP